MSDNNIPRKTPFIPHHDDETMLWEVKEITAESGSKYKVTWAGIDPENGNPWEPSWVSKSDCTDLAVAQWEAKKRGKVKPKNPGGGNAASVSGSKKEQQARPVVKRKRQPESEDTRDEDWLPDASTKSRKRALQIRPCTAGAIKIGPPRGAKRQDQPKQNATGPSSPACIQKSSCVESSLTGPFRVHAEEEEESSEDNLNRPQEALCSSTFHRLRNVMAHDFEHQPFPSLNDGHVKAGLGPEDTEMELNEHVNSTKLESQGREHPTIVGGPGSGLRATEPSVITADMTLNCWVRGHAMDHFPVTISGAEVVGALKKAIKNENSEEFRGVDPKDLTLFKTSLAFATDGSLEGILDVWTTSSLGKPLQSLQTLSTVFNPPPPSNQLHLVVEGLVPLQCWIRGKDFTEDFEVRVSMKASVSGLKKAIKAVHDGLEEVSPDRLNLYKIPDGFQVQEILDALGTGQLLRGTDLLEKIFNDIPFSRSPRIVIEPFDQMVSTPPSSGNDPITAVRAASPSPSTHVSLKVVAGVAKPDTTEPPKIPEVSAVEAGCLRKEDSDSGVPASSNPPHLEGLLAKVEEIKRLQCTISIAANAALKLGMEVIQIIDVLQENPDAEKK